ncbi:hypothetical protein NECAME_19211 [Necator americanus]|uniref:Uncharacterized protein n=1 Tax=Necator americanus TaxID=51031 RepID=W2SQC2_NECAM|nr:hypothetical protein NECAME_19211 [Necator americanus]ETN71713.1 hypothetical protein NECAME_19211 [Necator americanus]
MAIAIAIAGFPIPNSQNTVSAHNVGLCYVVIEEKIRLRMGLVGRPGANERDGCGRLKRCE